MKQTEIAKLKKEFKLDNEKLTVEKFAIGVIERGKIKEFKIREFLLMEDVERLIYMNLLKESLGGKVGKALLEYKVPAENFSNDSGVQKLYEINETGALEEDAVKEFMVDLVGKSFYDMPVCVTLADVTYNIPRDKKDVMDEDSEFSDSNDVVNFLLCNIIPLTFADMQLYFDEEKSELLKRINERGSLILSNKVTDSIMYPVLNDGATDVNYVLYRTKTPKNPNQSIIEEFLKCKYTMSGVDEQNKMVDTLYGTFGEEVEYEAIIGMKKELKKIEAEDSDNPEVTTVDGGDLASSIRDLGYNDAVAEKFEKKYRENFGEDVTIKSVNVLNTESTTYKTDGVSVTVKQKALDKVSIQKVNGVRSIVIAVDETLKVDDFIVKK